jgi:hypothetical protein
MPEASGIGDWGRSHKNMRHLLMLSMLAVMGCSQKEFRAPSGYSLIASIQVTEDAFEGPVEKYTGTQFYLEKGSGSSGAGPDLLVYSLVNGRVVEAIGGRMDESELERIMKTMPARPFDFAERVSKVDERLTRDAKMRGVQREYPAICLDGWKLKAVIMTKGGPMEFSDWNPRPIIFFYSKHDPMIKSVDTYLDVLAAIKGRASLGI